jgi:RHS repeat-associated protein
MTVAYNFLNLPTSVDFGSGNKIEWAYTVTGAKLRKTVYTNGTVTLTQDYVSGFVYKNGSLDFFATETGRVKVQSGGTMRHEYNLTDHLGNTRVMFEETSGTPTVIEESHYYAFGMRIEGLSTSSPDNKFTYNGKELEDDHGLNWYHYGARFYDAQIGRWHAVDPKDELMSPYIYVANNPLILKDPDGRDIFVADNLKNDKHFVAASKVLLATQLGKEAADQLYNNPNIVVAFVGDDLKGHNAFTQNIANNEVKLSSGEVVKIPNSEGQLVILVAVDKAGLPDNGIVEYAETLFHEMKAHVLDRDLDPNSRTFGRSKHSIDEAHDIYGRSQTGETPRPGSLADTFLKQAAEAFGMLTQEEQLLDD